MEADVLLKAPTVSKPVLLLSHVLFVIVESGSPCHDDSTYCIKISLPRACSPLVAPDHVNVLWQADIQVAVAYLSSVVMVSNEEWALLIERLKDDIGSQVAMHKTKVVHVLDCVE